MEYLNSRKQDFNRYMLYVGYFFVSIAIIFGAIALVYEAYGVGLKDGVVVQNGLIYFSSQPNPANIYINNQQYRSKTNTKALLQAGIYNVRISAPGYRDWHRTIELDGNSVEHFDYPLLFPTKLTPSQVHSYGSSPAVASQSPDQRWVVVSNPTSLVNYDVYDLKTTTKPPVQVTLPSDVLTTATSSESMQAIAWADDNTHLMLKHNYDGKSEYVLFNRTNPEQSLNINKALSVNPVQLSFKDQKFDQYYAFDPTAGTLQTLSLKSGTPVNPIDHVLNFASFGNDTVLYVTDSGATTGKVLLKLTSGGQTYDLHEFKAGTNYVLAVNQYNSKLYVAAGAASENKVYIYADPIGQLNINKKILVPAQVLHVPQPSYLSFSQKAQFVIAENGQQFGVYDIENTQGYIYSLPSVMDQPQTHADWVDEFHLGYVSAGKLVVFDYDGTNSQKLLPASPQYAPFFVPDYTSLLSLGQSSSTGATALQATPLVIR